MKIFSKKVGINKEAAPHFWIYPIAWQKFNLLGRFQFHKQQSVINIDEMISFLEQKIVLLQLKVTE